MTSIIETLPGKPDFHLFTELPDALYPADCLRYKTMETVPEAFLKACYLLVDEGRIVGRASVYDNPMLSYQGQHAFAVGNYECADNPAFAAVLLGHVMNAVKNWGGQYLIGPMNGSTWDSYRFGTSHENPVFFTETYQHLYYHDHFRDAGFVPIARYFSNIDRSMHYDDPAVLQREREFREEGVTIRSIDPSRFETEIERIYTFNAVAFKSNFLYTPISKEAFMKKYTQTKNYIQPAFTLLAEDAQGELIGFFFCIDDFFNTGSKSLVVKTLARHPAPQWRGLGHVIGNIIYRKAVELGYISAIHSFVYERGTSTKLSENFSGVNYKNYLLYGREIG